VLHSGVLGRIVQVESHFDRYRPVVPNRWREQNLPGSGLWFDLGSHLVDQALHLFGLPQAIQLDLACQRDGAQVNDYFHAQLRYGPRDAALRVLLHGSTLMANPGPRFVVHGTLGTWTKYGLDGQEDALKAGARPLWGQTDHWGVDPQPGLLTLPAHDQTSQQTASQQAIQPAPVNGNYLAYYAGLRDCLLRQRAGQNAQPDVSPVQVESAMRLLVTGQQSAAADRWITV